MHGDEWEKFTQVNGLKKGVVMPQVYATDEDSCIAVETFGFIESVLG